jgi:hypothetical protein
LNRAGGLKKIFILRVKIIIANHNLESIGMGGRDHPEYVFRRRF